MRQKPTVVISGFSYFPPQTGKTDMYEYSRFVSKKFPTILITGARSFEKKEEDISSRIKVMRAPVETEKESPSSILLFIVYSVYFLVKKRKDIKIYHFINPFSFSSLIFIIIRLTNFIRLTNIKIIYDIRTGPLRIGWRLKINNYLIRASVITAHESIILFRGLEDNIFRKRKNLNVIPLGFSLDKSIEHHSDVLKLKKDLKIKENEVVLIYVGSTYYRRRVDSMIKSFIKASEKSKIIRLLILGKKEEYLKKYFSKERVNFLGEVPYTHVSKYLSISNGGLAWVPQTSYFMNQPPLKTLEYLGHGLPVLATATCGNMELVEQGVNGLVAKDNVKDFSKGILDFIRQLSKMKPMARKSVNKYKWENIVNNKLIPLYVEVLKNEN